MAVAADPFEERVPRKVYQWTGVETPKSYYILVGWPNTAEVLLGRHRKKSPSRLMDWLSLGRW